MPSVSVVVPAFNAAEYIAETLDSVSRQTVTPLEVIVVDDGSSDATAKIAANHSLEPLVITKRNSGNAVARNRGIAGAHGEWIAFLDQDDLWHPEHLGRALALADTRGVDAVSMGKRSFAIPGVTAVTRAPWVEVWTTQAEISALVQTALEETDEVREIALFASPPTCVAQGSAPSPPLSSPPMGHALGPL